MLFLFQLFSLTLCFKCNVQLDLLRKYPDKLTIRRSAKFFHVVLIRHFWIIEKYHLILHRQLKSDDKRDPKWIAFYSRNKQTLRFLVLERKIKCLDYFYFDNLKLSTYQYNDHFTYILIASAMLSDNICKKVWWQKRKSVWLYIISAVPKGLTDRPGPPRGPPKNLKFLHFKCIYA